MRRSVVPAGAILGALSLGIAGTAPALASGPPSDNPDMGPLTSISLNVYEVGVIGDIEGDGDNDIAVASGAGDTFQFFINDGNANPTFTPSAVHSLPATCGGLTEGWVVLADFVPSGDLEFAVHCSDGGMNNNVLVYSSAGGAPLHTYTGHDFLGGLAATELGGDQVVAIATTTGDLVYFDLNGLYTETVVPVTPPPGFFAWFQGAYAFTYAGQPAVLVQAVAAGHGVSVIVTNGDGSSTLTIPEQGAHAKGDFDANGLEDIVFYDEDTFTDFVVHYQLPDGSFLQGAAVSIGPGLQFRTMQYALQCYPDVLTFSGQGTEIVTYGNQGDRTYAATGTIFDITGLGAIIDAGDLNGDGRPDFVWSDQGGDGQGLYVSIQNVGSPFVTTQPVSVSGGGPGQPVEFTIDAEPAFFVQWQRAAAGTEDWTDIPGAEGSHPVGDSDGCGSGRSVPGAGLDRRPRALPADAELPGDLVADVAGHRCNGDAARANWCSDRARARRPDRTIAP